MVSIRKLLAAMIADDNLEWIDEDEVNMQIYRYRIWHTQVRTHFLLYIWMNIYPFHGITNKICHII